MRHTSPTSRLRGLFIILAVGLAMAACGGAGSPTGASHSASAEAIGAQPSGAPGTPATASPSGSPGPAASPSGSQAPEPSGGTTAGDIPDNAVFLTFHATSPAFSIQYVEGWQVTPQPSGVVIRDKDSSETVALVASPADIAAYVASTDLPALRVQPGFALVKQDTLKAGASTYIHVAFHVTSPPDAVTGKQVPLTVDRYYVPGSSNLAIVSLATPDGVDNVDAFRRIIESFRWS